MVYDSQGVQLGRMARSKAVLAADMIGVYHVGTCDDGNVSLQHEEPRHLDTSFASKAWHLSHCGDTLIIGTLAVAAETKARHYTSHPTYESPPLPFPGSSFVKRYGDTVNTDCSRRFTIQLIADFSYRLLTVPKTLKAN